MSESNTSNPIEEKTVTASAVEEEAATPAVEGQPTATEQPAEGQAAAAAPETTTIRVKERVRTGKRPTGKKKRSVKKIVIAIVCVIAVIIACAAVGFAYMKHKGEEAMTGAPQAAEQELTVKYKGHEYMYNDSTVSILFEGIDDESGYTSDGGSCSDANFLFTMDTSTNKVNIVTVPRDSMCEVDVYNNGKYQFTTHTNLGLAYAIDADKDTRAQNVAKSVSTIMEGMPVNYYFAMNVHAIEDLADAVGGVKVTALQTIPGTNIVKGQKINLTGEDAFKYVQYRDVNVAKSALDRQARQDQFIQAFMAKAKKMSVTQLLKVVKAVSSYSVTNVGAEEMSYLASCFIAGDKASVSMDTLTGTTKTKVYDTDGLEHEYIKLSKKSIHKAVIESYYKQIGE